MSGNGIKFTQPKRLHVFSEITLNLIDSDNQRQF